MLWLVERILLLVLEIRLLLQLRLLLLLQLLRELIRRLLMLKRPRRLCRRSWELGLRDRVGVPTVKGLNRELIEFVVVVGKLIEILVGGKLVLILGCLLLVVRMSLVVLLLLVIVVVVVLHLGQTQCTTG